MISSQIFQENVVEYPKNYALEIYVGNPTDEVVFCRLNTPKVSSPYYDATVAVQPGSTRVSWDS